MANPTVEILIKAKDQFSDATKRANLDFAAMKIGATDAEKEISKLTRTYGLSRDVAEDVNKALASQAGHYDNASLAARGLGQELGISMPRAVTAFLAKSELIGPMLSSAFSVVAVVGMIGALGQIPAAFDSLSAAITGWDEKAKKAYDNFIEYNRKAVDRVRDFKAQMAEITTVSLDPQAGKRAGLQSQLEDLQADQARYQKAARDAQEGVVALTRLPRARGGQTMADRMFSQAGTYLGAQLGISSSGGRSLSELKKDAEDSQKAANDTADKITNLNEQLKKLGAEAATASAKIALSIQRDMRADLLIGHPAGFPLPVNPPIVPTLDPMTGEWHYPATLYGKVNPLAEQQYEFQKKLDDAVEANMNLPLQPGRVPMKPILTPDFTRSGGMHLQTLLSDGQIDPFAEKKWEEMQKRQDAFIERFRQGSGQVWEAFFSKGGDVLSRLANVATGWLNQIGRTLFENMATGLLFGSNAKSSPASILGGFPGGSGAGLFGSILGGGGSSGGLLGGGLLGSIPGLGGGGLLGKLGSGGGLLGALFGGGGAAAASTASTLGPLAGLSGAGGALAGFGTAVAPPAGGLLGMGALFSNPWTIGIAAGILGGIGLFALFSHHRDAPFTRDPNDYRSRDFFFFSGSQALKDAADTIKQVYQGVGPLTTMTPQVLVSQGMPLALQSSPSLAQKVTGTLAMGDS